MSKIFPWLLTQWQQLTERKRKKTLPHGLLLSGPQGTGKFVFAKQLAQFALCEKPMDMACDSCRACQLFAADTHPDILIVQPEEGSRAIKIDQIRLVVDEVGKTTFQGGYRIIIVEPAEAMNKQASNALLKTLEEPRSDTLIILISHHPLEVAATIKSRCEQINLPIPSKMSAKKWLSEQLGSEHDAEIFLAITGNLPLKALAFAQSHHFEQRNQLLKQLQQLRMGAQEPTAVAASCLSFDIQELLTFLATVVMDILRLKFNSSAEFLSHRDKLSELEKLSTDFSVFQLFHYFDEVLQAIRQVGSQANLNNQLLLERLFIKWSSKDDIR